MKYVPLNEKSGKMTVGVHLDVYLPLVPNKLIELATVSFCEDFYNYLVQISRKFKGSPWDKAV